MIEASLALLLHLMMFAYWLGGDIGVFYSSTLLTDKNRDAIGRITAAKILNDVDLVPRICLLLALPTGLAAAAVKGWLTIGVAPILLAFAAAGAWIWLVWVLHHNHSEKLRRIDLFLRYFFLLALVTVAIAGFANLIAIPLFIALKLLILAFAILMGLLVRRALTPFPAAFAKLVSGDVDDTVNNTIKNCLDKARPAVVAIWIALIVAAWLGIATPV